MFKEVQEVAVVRTYKAVYEGKTVLFSLSKDIYDWQGQYRILEYDEFKKVPKDLEKKLLEVIDQLDFSDAELL